MILSKMSLKRRKDFLAEHPQTAKVIAALRATAGGATPMWLEDQRMVGDEEPFTVHIACLPSVARHGDPKPDPVYVAIRAIQQLFPQQPPLHQVQIHYTRHQVLVARGEAIIHWITESDERACADALGELDSDSTWEEIKTALTLPHPASAAWSGTDKFADDHTLAMWEIPAIGYVVEARDDRPFLVLRDPAGNWVPKTWWTVQEIADVYGYTPSSLRVAIQQGRLRSSKWGYTHRIAASDLRAALREGRLRPRD